MKITFTPTSGSETTIADGTTEPSELTSASGQQAIETAEIIRATSASLFARGNTTETVSLKISKQYASITAAQQACLYYPASLSRAQGVLKLLNPADSLGLQLNNAILQSWKLAEKMGVSNTYELTYVGTSYTQITS
jgi:hypothetical protein